MSTKKSAPEPASLQRQGGRLIHNSSWYMRNSDSITHSTSRGLVASVYITVFFILFCRILPNRRSDCTTTQQERQPRKRRHTPRTASCIRLASAPPPSRAFVPTTDHGFRASRPPLLRKIPAQSARIRQVDSLAPNCQFAPIGAAHPRCPYALTAVVRVVHRKSYIVHRRRQPPPPYVKNPPAGLLPRAAQEI